MLIPWDDVQLKSSVLIILPWAADGLLPTDLHLLDPHQALFQKGHLSWQSFLQGPSLSPGVIWRCEEAPAMPHQKQPQGTELARLSHQKPPGLEALGSSRCLEGVW